MQPFPWPSRQNWIKIRRPCHVLLPNCFSSRLRSAWSNQKVPRDIQCQPIQATLENVQSETRSSSEHATSDSWTIFVVVTCAQLAEISSCFATCLPNDLIVTTNLRVLKKKANKSRNIASSSSSGRRESLKSVKTDHEPQTPPSLWRESTNPRSRSWPTESVRPGCSIQIQIRSTADL